MIKKILLILFPLICFAQTYVTVPDKERRDQLTAAEFNQILDAIKDGTLSLNTASITINGHPFILPDSLSAAIDSALDAALGSDRVAVNIKDIKNRIYSNNNFYDYQDAAINEALQMPVRYMQYLHEQYYHDDSVQYEYDFGSSGSDYSRDRKGLAQGYLSFLMAAHSITGRDKYWYELLDTYEGLLNWCDTVMVTGVDTCYSIILYPELAGTSSVWSWADCSFHRAGIYIYEQDNSYTEYLANSKAFADVAWNKIDKDTYDGWGWGYNWTAGTASQIVNTSSPFLEFYSYMKKTGNYTSTITSARIDSILDSTYTYINESWVDGTVYGSDSTGYWDYDIGGSSNAAFQYFSEIAGCMFQTMLNISSDTTWQSDFGNKMQKLMNYYTAKNSVKINLMREYSAIDVLPVLKWGQTLGFSFADDSIAYSWIKQGLGGNFFGGLTYPEQDINKYPRWQMHRFWESLARLVENFNDNAFSETYLKRAYNWTTAIAGYYYYDGAYLDQQNEVMPYSTIANHGLGIGYRTADSSPSTQDPDTASSFVDDVLTMTLPTPSTTFANGNGLQYTVSHKMGSVMWTILPSSADSVIVYIPIEPSTYGNLYYMFYYNASNVLDTIKISDWTVGDSILVQPSKGVVFCPLDNSTGLARPVWGMAQDTTSVYVTRLTNGASISKFSFPENSKKLYVTASVSHVGALYWNATQGYDETFNMMEDYMAYIRKFLANGISYTGILEDKTQ